MPEFRSPITPGRKTDGTALQLSEGPAGGLLQLAGWDNFETAVAPALAQFGFAGLGGYRAAQSQGEATAFRIAPDRLLLRHRASAPLLAAAETLDPATCCSLDLSHARWVFTIAGPAGPDLLARLLPIDGSPEALPVGHFAQSGLHHVGVLLHHRAETAWDLLVPVTWADSLWDYLCEAATPLLRDVVGAA